MPVPPSGLDPAIEVRGLGKVFEIVRRKKTAAVDLNTLAQLSSVVSRAFNDEAQRESVRTLQALADVDLTVWPGEVLGIVGRNGAGKSTLLKILARVVDPTTGSVRMRGRVVSLLELGLGFAPDLPVRDNIRLYGQLAGIRGRDIRAAEEEILEFSGLTAHGDVPLKECPGGSFVRLAFAAMMGLKADIVLADEVLAVGDKRFREACEERIRNAGQSGEAVLFVSHDLEAIKRICTRAIWIDKGRIRMSGGTVEVVDAYVSDLFAGRLVQPGEVGAAGRLDGVSLASPDGGLIGAMQMDAEAYLQCLYRIDRPGIVARLRIEVWQGKHHVFTTHSPWSQPSVQAESLRATVLLPPHFFNEATYTARVVLSMASAGDRNDTVRAPGLDFEFQVMNTDNESSVWAGWNWSRPGLVSPRIPWRGPRQRTSA